MCESQNCLKDLLETIICLQNTKDTDCEVTGCDKPYLGPTQSLICYNTRPINFYNCCTGNLWSFPYQTTEGQGTSTVFRLENLENDCCTCRILAPNTDSTSTEPYILTNTYFTIKLDCIAAVKCQQDIYLSGI